MDAENTTVASRLCASCGMCCDGALFDLVKIQPEDSVRELKARGLSIKKKHGENFFAQPCPAHRECACFVYEHRPQRCRLFNCQQLMNVESGKITEEEAQEKIRETRLRIKSVLDLLVESGSTNKKRSLRTRYVAALAQPIEQVVDPRAFEVRERLTGEMEKLDEIFKQDFRI